MFNDWIKMRVDLYNDPKVILIADELMDPGSPLAAYVNQNCQCDMAVTHNIMRSVTVGALVTVWGIARHQGNRQKNHLVLENCRIVTIDEICHIPGFGDAMIAAGWLRETKDQSGLVFPKFFEEKNVDPETKRKSDNALRQQRFRDRHKKRNDNVTITTELEREREIENNNSSITLQHEEVTPNEPAAAVDSLPELPGGPAALLLSEVVAALTKCGMDPQVIPKLTANHSLQKIMQAIKMVKGRGNSVRNIAGLVRAWLEGDWESESAVCASEDAEDRFEEQRKIDIAQAEAERAEKREQHRKQHAKHQKHLEILAALPPGEFDKLKEAAHKEMPPGLSKKVDPEGDPMEHGVWRSMMWREYEKSHAAPQSGDLLPGTV